MRSFIFLIFAAFSIVACSHHTASQTEYRNYRTSFKPEKLIVRVAFNVPKALKQRVGKKDSLVWTVADDKGQVVAAGIRRNIRLPFYLVVLAKDLLHPVSDNASIIVSTRIVKKGDEFKPPKSNQLMAIAGGLKESAQIVRPAVSEKILQKVEKKFGYYKARNVAVGEHVDVEFGKAFGT